MFWTVNTQEETQSTHIHKFLLPRGKQKLQERIFKLTAFNGLCYSIQSFTLLVHSTLPFDYLKNATLETVDFRIY